MDNVAQGLRAGIMVIGKELDRSKRFNQELFLAIANRKKDGSLNWVKLVYDYEQALIALDAINKINPEPVKNATGTGDSDASLNDVHNIMILLIIVLCAICCLLCVPRVTRC